MQNKAPRLHFTEDDLEHPSVERAAEKAEKAADKADAAKARLPTKSKLKHKKEQQPPQKNKLRFGKKDVSGSDEIPSGRASKPDVKNAEAPMKSGESGRVDGGTRDTTMRPQYAAPKTTNTGKSTVGSTKRSAMGESSVRKSKLRIEPEQKPNLRSRLRFDQSAEEIKAPARRGRHMISKGVSGSVHRQISKSEDDNVGVEAAHKSEEFAEGSGHIVSDGIYSRKTKAYNKAAKLEKKADKANINALYQQQKAADPENFSNPISRRMQKKNIRKQYYAEKRAASYTNKAASAGASAADKAGKAKDALMQFLRNDRKSIAVLLLVAVFVLLIVTLFQSCSTIASGTISSIAATSWPADDEEITKAESYYTKLEAQLQKEIYDIESSSDADEYSYNIDEIGHDPTLLISYLCAKYGDFTFNEVKSELDTIFALQYQLATEIVEETRTTTKTVQVGDYIGEVVTSGYCACTICCGSNANGITASGTTATANRTIAVDSSNPIVPIGSQVIINGVLYTVEDTGNLNAYGVDFDIFYDSHSEALAHGHQTVSAYYAGGSSGDEIEVTVTETVDVCYMTLTTNDFESILTSLLTEDQLEMYDIYNDLRGNRVFLGMPVDCYWFSNVSSYYGYEYDYSSGTVAETDCLTLSLPSGTEILSVLDGIVSSVSEDTIVLESEAYGYVVTLTGCGDISVSEGDAVETGQVIAEVESYSLEIRFSYKGASLNPYFYMDVGEETLSSVGTATGSAADLIAEAISHLGTPYVWGGYSPSGFDCSGFVSYCLTYSGALNTGHLNCRGLYAICTIIDKSELQPGDLVFFQGTYNTEPPSHVGIVRPDRTIVEVVKGGCR